MFKASVQHLLYDGWPAFRWCHSSEQTISHLHPSTSSWRMCSVWDESLYQLKPIYIPKEFLRFTDVYKKNLTVLLHHYNYVLMTVQWTFIQASSHIMATYIHFPSLSKKLWRNLSKKHFSALIIAPTTLPASAEFFFVQKMWESCFPA